MKMIIHHYSSREEGFFPNLFEQKYWKEITWSWYISYFGITHLIVVHLISTLKKTCPSPNPSTCECNFIWKESFQV